MTDKELRKLSRLELLELLLEASKENKKLKEETESLKTENKTAQNIENLSLAARQVESALKYANNLTDNLKNATTESEHAVTKSRTSIKNNSRSDSEIYKRILIFFAKNDEKLSVFPDDIEHDIRMRIKDLTERRNITD